MNEEPRQCFISLISTEPLAPSFDIYHCSALPKLAAASIPRKLHLRREGRWTVLQPNRNYLPIECQHFQHVDTILSGLGRVCAPLAQILVHIYSILSLFQSAWLPRTTGNAANGAYPRIR